MSTDLQWRVAGYKVKAICDVCRLERWLTHYRPAGRFNRWACFECAQAQNKGLEK